MSVELNFQSELIKYPLEVKRPGSDKLRAGLIIDLPFHEANKWVSATTWHLVEVIRTNFDCVPIQSQSDYESAIDQLDLLISMEPHWGGHKLNLIRTNGLREKIENIPSYILYSDPHANKWRQDYFLDNAFDYVLSFYNHPMRYHFRKINPDRMIHFPWAIPDDWISTAPIQYNPAETICCFGGLKSDAYALRNWCRQFDFVESASNSGCENKVMSEAAYIQWLGTKAACIAAGSDDSRYRLTVPKYFEIAAAGSLLFAQETDDLPLLGFVHGQNCVVFNRSNFESLAREYLENPQQYLHIRKQGRELIRQRHSLSLRMKNLIRHVNHVIEQKKMSKKQIQINTEIAASVSKTAHDEFDYWFKKICIPSVLEQAVKGPLDWEGRSLDWDACHEILAYHTYIKGAVEPKNLIVVSNHRYQLLDRLWPGEPLSKEKVEAFYRESATILPWGHGVFLADHKTEQRRGVWLKRVRLLEMLKKAGVTSVCDYGAGGGHTSLLAKAMGFSRVIHHEYSVFHPYVAWRQKQIPSVDPAHQFVMTCADEPLKLDEPVDAIICADVAEHVWDPKQMLKDIHAALKPGGYLVWNSAFGKGISSHLHPELKGREEELLVNHGFKRVGDFPVDYIGHSGLYRSVPVSVPANNIQKTPKTLDSVLENNQWRSRQEIEEIQWNMLKSLLAHTYEHVPFYRRRFEAHGIHPQDIQTMDDFQKIPVLRKADIQQNLQAMRAVNCPQDQLLQDATGGSTGQPLAFYRDMPAKEWLLAAARRFRRWMGYDSKSKLALIWGADRDIPKIARPNQRWLNAFNCSDEDIDRFMAELIYWQPDAIRAYSSSIAMVASYMQRKGFKAPRPRVIECAAEKLWDSQRKQIEEVFGCPVYEMYASRELPTVACECEYHEGMHIFSDIRLVESVDNGTPVAPGQEGSLVITDLVNYGMPFIRYEIGDVGVISPQSCACGRGFPLLKEVKGRVSSTIQTPDGRRIHGEYFTHLFYNVPAVKAFQVRQKKIDEITVLIQPDSGFEKSIVEPMITQMHQHLGNQVKIEWTCVDTIPLTPTGKRHFTISEIPADYIEADCRRDVAQIQSSQVKKTGRQKKILFIVDRPGWAHDFKTDNIMRQLGHLYDMKKVYCDQVKAEQVLAADLVVMYYWKQMLHENMKKLLGVFEKNRHKILMGICSHQELKDQWTKPGMTVLRRLAAGVFINSNLLLKEYGGWFHVPVFYTPNGVDTDFYVPAKQPEDAQILKVGWAGSIKNHGNIRGYHEFIIPTIEQLDGVELLTAAREAKWRNTEQMRQFYQLLDLYICASQTEGTPNPCLEAMACGVPVLTTYVGNMPELIEPGVNGLFIERDIRDISEKIKRLRDDRDFLNQLRQGARRSIQNWDWNIQADNYHNMFVKMLKTTACAEAPCKCSMPDTLELFRQAQEQFAIGNRVTAQRLNAQYREAVDYNRFNVVRSSSRKADPLLSVVVVTYNRPDKVEKCIETLHRQQWQDFEIVIVDNGDVDKKAVALTGQVDVYVDCPINFNLSEGRNIGAHFANGQILVFLDDDALVGPDYLESIRKAFEQYEILGLRGRAFPKNGQKSDNRVSVYDLGEEPFAALCNQEGNSAFRRDAYLAVGGMDALLFGHEGSDLSYRLIRRYNNPSAVIYWPGAVIYHDYGSQNTLDEKAARYSRNRDYLKSKYDVDVIGLKEEIAGYELRANQSGCLCPPLPVEQSTVEPKRMPAVTAANGPKVSIVMSCRNVARFLPETMDTILAQTLKEWELLVTDDGSTDATRNILETYAAKDKRIRLWFFDTKEGPYVRRNFAIEQAKTPFICIQDADDLMAANKLEILYEEISHDQRLGIVGSFYRRFFDTFRGADFGDRMEKRITHEELMAAFPNCWHLCWHGSAIIRKSLFKIIGPYDEQPYGSDTFWLSKAGLYGLLTGQVRFKNLPDFLTYKREHAQSQTGKISPADPRSRRHRLERYYLQKLQQIVGQAKANPSMDVAREIRECTCADFIPQFGHLFGEWESAPVNDTMIQGLINRGLSQFSSEQYTSALITLNCLDQMVSGGCQSYRNLNFTRGLAYYAGGDDEQASANIQKEIQLFRNENARVFLSRYLETDSRAVSSADRRANIRRFIAEASPSTTSPVPPQEQLTPPPSDLQERLALAKQYLCRGRSEEALCVYRGLLSDNKLAGQVELMEKLKKLVDGIRLAKTFQASSQAEFNIAGSGK